ncbi:UpxY family transcription antiterminator [Roseivirga sp. BDSF3-8]|uniref:UpxY family transcription antiterminator n=1 Tax=Roseivirga sp. BDSF3-8 TaxID=3241598 RepID=UPI0035326EE4
MERTDSDWYAVYTYPRIEKKIFSRLSNSGVEAFLPLTTVIRQWSDRKKKLTVPLFPNYIFVRIDPKEKYRVLQVEGVVKFVSIQGNPCRMPEAEIETIKKLASSGSDITTNEELVEGMPIRIVDGPLTGVEGVLEEKKGKTRLLVRIDSLRQTACVDVSAAMIERLSPSLAG